MTCPIAGIHFHLHPSDRLPPEEATDGVERVQEPGVFYGIPVYIDGDTPGWIELHLPDEPPILRVIEP